MRAATVGDIEPIKAILLGTLEEYGLTIPEDYPVSDIDSVGIQNSVESVFVLEKATVVIGFIVLRPMTATGIELKRLYLTPSERGQGLGRFLLNYAVDFAIKSGRQFVQLETTSKFKEAVSLYKQNGFVELKGIQTAPGHDLAFRKALPVQ